MRQVLKDRLIRLTQEPPTSALEMRKRIEDNAREMGLSVDELMGALDLGAAKIRASES